MSTDTLLPRPAADTAIDPWTTAVEAPPAPRQRSRPVEDRLVDAEPPHVATPQRVSPATLAAHAIDRADARLERLRDELDLLRTKTGPGIDIDPEETRLIFAIVEAERSRVSLDAPQISDAQQVPGAL